MFRSKIIYIVTERLKTSYKEQIVLRQVMFLYIIISFWFKGNSSFYANKFTSVESHINYNANYHSIWDIFSMNLLFLCCREGALKPSPLTYTTLMCGYALHGNFDAIKQVQYNLRFGNSYVPSFPQHLNFMRSTNKSLTSDVAELQNDFLQLSTYKMLTSVSFWSCFKTATQNPISVHRI